MWEEIVQLYDQYGGEQYMISEPITQAQHALQTYNRMRQHTSSPHLGVAALLHDIGHLLVASQKDTQSADPINGIDDSHEVVGANWLAQQGFPKGVTEPIRLHVKAKRYLCFDDPTYYNTLSKGSQLSIALQGGPLGFYEARLFSLSEYFPEALLLRKCDDEGKDMDVDKLPKMKDLKNVVIRVF